MAKKTGTRSSRTKRAAAEVGVRQRQNRRSKTRVVVMTKPHANNAVGDRCGFPEAEAVELVKEGKAVCSSAGPHAWHIDEQGVAADGPALESKPVSSTASKKKASTKGGSRKKTSKKAAPEDDASSPKDSTDPNDDTE